MVNIKIKLLRDGASLPEFQTAGSAGADMYFAPADEQPVTLQPGGRAVLSAGFAMEIPKGYEVQVRPRSGLALKHGITVLNSPGTIDSDYRGEMGVLLINHSSTPFEFKPGDRIAQMVLNEVPACSFTLTDSLSETVRGAGGYGSTGISEGKLCGAWEGSDTNEDGSIKRCTNPVPCGDHAGMCRSPSGCVTAHGQYAQAGEGGTIVCSFCKQPVFSAIPRA